MNRDPRIELSEVRIGIRARGLGRYCFHAALHIGK